MDIKCFKVGDRVECVSLRGVTQKNPPIQIGNVYTVRDTYGEPHQWVILKEIDRWSFKCFLFAVSKEQVEEINNFWDSVAE